MSRCVCSVREFCVYVGGGGVSYTHVSVWGVWKHSQVSHLPVMWSPTRYLGH